MKNTPPPISDAEALVMRELWGRSPQGADEIALRKALAEIDPALLAMYLDVRGR